MRSILVLVILGMLIPTYSQAQLFKKSRNQETDTLKNGLHYEYWDRDSVYLSARGHFCNGSPCKKWKYFWKDGTRRMKVKYRDNLKIKYYRESGKLDQKGYAILDLNAERIHFYWHGLWKYYDNKRKLYRIALYENGEEIKVLFGPEDPFYFE